MSLVDSFMIDRHRNACENSVRKVNVGTPTQIVRSKTMGCALACALATNRWGTACNWRTNSVRRGATIEFCTDTSFGVNFARLHYYRIPTNWVQSQVQRNHSLKLSSQLKKMRWRQHRRTYARDLWLKKKTTPQNLNEFNCYVQLNSLHCGKWTTTSI